MSSNNKYRTLASNIIILGIGQFGSKMLGYVMLNFYTSMLGKSDYGDLTNIINAASLLISVATLSIADGVLRFGLEKANDGKSVYSIGINVAFIGLVIFAAFIPLIGLLPMLKGYEWLIYIYVFMGAIKEISAIYVRTRKSVTIYAVDGIVTTVSMIAYSLILMGVFHLGILGYVLAVVLGDLTSMIFLNATTKLFKEYRPFGNDKAMRRSMVLYSIPLMPTMIMWWIINVSDSFMVTAFLGSDANGIYGVSYKFPNLASVIVGIFSQAWRISAITERNSRTVSNFYSNIFSMMQTVMFLACGGIMLFLRPLLMPFFAAEEFQPAYFYVPMLLAAVIFQSFSNFLASIYEAAQKTTHSLISSAIGAVSNIILNLILIPTIGTIGAAVATLTSYMIVFFYRIVDTKKYLYMKVYWAKIIVNMTLLAGMAVSIMALPYGTLQNIINAVIFIIITAINFSSCVQAVKLILNKNKNKNESEKEEKE